MPTTPELWLSDQIVNATNDDPYSSHGEPVITQLSNGNIVVVWEGKEGRSPYASTYFRIFDPLGNALTDQIKVADEAYRPVVTALDDGGFLITDLWGVYSGLDPWHNWVESFRFDAEGDQVDYTLHEQISHGGYSDDDQRGLASASVSANSVMIVNTDYNGYSEERLYFQIYDPLADTTSIELPIAVSSGQPGSGVEGVSVAALSNGTYAVAYGLAQSSTETDLYVARFNSAGGLLGMTTVSNTTMISNDPSIVGLTGGGFVVTWMLDGSGGTDSGIRFRVYDNSGNAVTGVLNPLTTVSGNQNEPVVLALDDGGFAIIWDDDNLSDIKGQRFDADGDRVGGEFNIDTGGSQTNISATGLADGRFAVTWQEGDDVRMEIYDVRDFVYGVSYDGSGTWHIGTVGDDAITEGAGIDVVRGRAGDDTVFVTSGIGSDSFKGGAGTDTIDWSGTLIVGGDAVFDLEAGTASAGGQTEEMIGFENLNGSNNWDTIIGTGGDNILNGNGGDDTIDGGSGEDVIDGGSGNDLVIDSDGPGFGRDVGGGGVDTLWIGESSSFQLYPGLHYDLSAGQASWRDLLSGNLIGGDTFTGFENITLARSAAVTGTAGDNEIIFSPNVLGNNTINGLAGADWIVGGGGADTIDGGSESDVIYGEGGDDILLGGAGADWLDGGSGFDFASYDGSASAVMVDLAAGVGYGGDAQGDRYFGIENVSGSAFDDTLIGDGDDVTLIGGEGNDTLRGGAGSDTLDGGGGIDTLDGMAGDDFYFVENAADIVVAAVGEGSDRVFAGVSFTLGAGVEIEMLTALNPALATALDLTGNEIAQTMIGNAGANWLRHGRRGYHERPRRRRLLFRR